MLTGTPNRLSFPAQLLTTGIIVAVLAGAARLASSDEDSRAFDEAAEHTRFQLEGAARGAEAVGPVDGDDRVPEEHEEP